MNKILKTGIMVAMVILGACSNPYSGMTPEAAKVAKQIDEMLEYAAKTGDFSYLDEMIALCDTLSKIDKPENRLENASKKCVIFNKLGMEKERFVAMEEYCQQMDEDEPERLIYFGMKAEFSGNLNEANQFYERAVIAADKRIDSLKKPLYVHKKVEALVYLHREEAVKRTYEECARKFPKDNSIRSAVTTWRAIISMVQDYKNKCNYDPTLEREKYYNPDNADAPGRMRYDPATGTLTAPPKDTIRVDSVVVVVG